MNPDIRDEFYGDHLIRASKKKKSVSPKPEDFRLPRSEANWNAMMGKMSECGIDKFET